MIIVLLIIAIICFIYFNVIPGKFHTPVAWISLIITGLCIVGIVEHDYNHWGMKEQTTTETQRLSSSASPQLPILLYQPLGNGTEKVYLYKTADKPKKLLTTKTDKLKTTVVNKNSKTAKITVKTTRYVYKSKLDTIMFSIFGRNEELKEREYIFYLPKNWQVLSVKKAKQLQKQMQQRAALMKKRQILTNK
ncbi:hypothetical protein J2Z60_001847 [Lactobacillus colini]|uniref:DUF4811 domain-containing protein n=1 Tax=Lactobacillus colini TaxID=1819254 RepID=A0ABS4MG41_9LACO|nr:DUF4811 domain-containing protein [Lactobacillus colini]MBP2058659.1 hypothetical protein [Lactobacillus colini]